PHSDPTGQTVRSLSPAPSCVFFHRFCRSLYAILFAPCEQNRRCDSHIFLLRRRHRQHRRFLGLVFPQTLCESLSFKRLSSTGSACRYMPPTDYLRTAIWMSIIVGSRTIQ